MAEWRAKGYVPDSDEEDETQGSLRKEHQDGTQDSEVIYDDAVKAIAISVEVKRKSQEASDEAVGTTENEKSPGSFPPLEATGDNLDHGILANSQTGLSYLEPAEDLYIDSAISQIEDLPRKASEYVDADTSGASSPLSEAPSSLPDLPTLFGPLEEEHPVTQAFEFQRPDGQLESRALDEITSHERQDQVHKTTKFGRTFRRRNAIQLHPYIIEKETFNQTWRARGLKPVHILQEEAARAQAEEREARNFEISEDEKNSRSSPRGPTTVTSLSPRSQQEEGYDDGDGDLPDLCDLPDFPRGMERSFLSLGSKRRRVGPKFRRPPKLPPRKHDLLPVRNENNSPDDDHPFNPVPLSPPLSGHQTPARPLSDAEDSSPVPFGADAVTLPTPVTSSVPSKGQSKRTVLIDDDSDELSPNPHHAKQVSIGREISSDEEADNQLQRAQRRIKGVLPASWLKLDLKTQAKKPQKEHRFPVNISPGTGSRAKGVARPASKDGEPTGQPRSRQEVFVLSDDGSPGSDHDMRVRTAVPVSEFRPFDFGGEDPTTVWGEAMEHDRVDSLLPSARRSTTSAKRSRKHQTKLQSFRSRPGRNVKISPLASSFPEPRGSHQRANRQQKRAFRPPNLSILDTPDREDAPDLPNPSFLKVARRTARLRHDKGRHSPSRKFLRLATSEDTNDMNATMRAWREGSIAPRIVQSSHTIRKPLHPRSANNASSSTRTLLPGVPKPGDVMIPMGKSVRSRPRTSATRNSFRSLADFVSRQPPVRYDRPSLDLPPLQEPLQLNDVRRRGDLLSTLKTASASRPAMLESSSSTMERDKLHPQAAAYQRFSTLNEDAENHQLQRSVLDRFLHDEDSLVTVGKASTTKKSNSSVTIEKPSRPSVMRARKRRPKRVDVAAPQIDESSVPDVIDGSPVTNEAQTSCGATRDDKIQGLGTHGTSYSITFDISPFAREIRLASGSFVGSGDFEKTLTLQTDCDLDRSRGLSHINYDGKECRWGSWNETVSLELGEVFGRIEQNAQSMICEGVECDAMTIAHILDLQSAIVSYITSHISFSDAIDRVAFLRRCKGLLLAFSTACGQSLTTALRMSTKTNPSSQVATRIPTLNLVLAHQLRQISQHSIVPLQMKEDIGILVQACAKQSFVAIESQLSELDRYLVRYRHSSNRGRVLHIDDPVIEAFVILNHVLHITDTRQVHPLEILHDQVSSISMKGIINVGISERIWHQLFALLPFLEFNTQGTLEGGQPSRVPRGHWNLVKKLMSPFLENYEHNPGGQGPGFNAYCRCLFSRCLHLITVWGWYDCDSIIGTLFDFFARNNLGNLRNEASYGSPEFLENLSRHPQLLPEPRDRCFHLLLKIIGSGVKYTQTVYNPKKVRDLIWRLMPNHGRSHPKDQDVRQEVLDALRNHHDLLCTLYWASPTGFRPSLNGIRNLVDLGSSHREACHINIRAWFNLVKFQLSIEEPVENLEQFMHWHADFVRQMIRQHEFARTEAEGLARSVLSVSGMSISKNRLESTIEKNQRQVEAVLSDALVCLDLAIGDARSRTAAGLLLSPALTGAFSVFDGARGLSNGIIVKALNVLLAYTNKCTSKKHQSALQHDNDESQDYGDWTMFNDDDDDIVSDADVQASSSPLLPIVGPLRTLVSNCFGADTMPLEILLTKSIDAWVAVSSILVDDGVKSWEDYLGQFGVDAWHTLRNTDQTRKYSAYFFSSLIETNAHVYYENRLTLVKAWLDSLVERQSLLKFQHRFTTVLLNIAPTDPLLLDVPFCKSGSSGRIDMTAVDLSDRRLALISSIFFNMRVSLDNAHMDPDLDVNQLRQEYKELLKHLMAAMKQNFSELGQSSHMRGAYVDFVHFVVELLQEHTATICPVDRFFTDNVSFPLPTSDPNYVVGKLKSYGMRLSDAKMQKETVVFLQSVSERAALDGQQKYLIGQLQMAMSTSSKDAATKLALHQLILKAVVPAYLQIAIENPAGWILAMPFLKALQWVFEKIHMDLNSCDKDSLDQCLSLLTGFLNYIRMAVSPLKDTSDSFGHAFILNILTACYQAIIALLPTLDYALLFTSYEARGLALETVSFFKTFATYVNTIIAPIIMIEPPPVDDLWSSDAIIDVQYSEVHKFAFDELQTTLNKSWTCVGSECFVARGSSRLQVKVPIASYAEARDTLRLALHEFGECLTRMSGLGGWEEWHAASRRLPFNNGDDELVF